MGLSEKGIGTVYPIGVAFINHQSCSKMAGKVGVIAGNMFDHILHKPRISVKKNHQEMDCDLPSVKRLHNYGKSPFCSWENSLFLLPFSIAMYITVYQAGYIILNPIKPP